MQGGRALELQLRREARLVEAASRRRRTLSSVQRSPNPNPAAHEHAAASGSVSRSGKTIVSCARSIRTLKSQSWQTREPGSTQAQKVRQP